MSNSGLSIKPEAIREMAFGSIAATYAELGSVLGHDCFRVSVHNTCDTDMYISVDGVDDHYRIAASSGQVFDEKTNDMYRKAGTQFHVRYVSAPSEGTVWIQAEYT